MNPNSTSIDKKLQLKTVVYSTVKYTGNVILMHPSPSKKEGHIALHMSVCRSVGMSVSLNLVQLITQERFAPEASNLVRR